MLCHGSCVSWMADLLYIILPTPCTIVTSTSCILLDSNKTGPVSGKTQHEPTWNDPDKLPHYVLEYAKKKKKPRSAIFKCEHCHILSERERSSNPFNLLCLSLNQTADLEGGGPLRRSHSNKNAPCEGNLGKAIGRRSVPSDAVNI
jgi:hypothetical protein